MKKTIKIVLSIFTIFTVILIVDAILLEDVFNLKEDVELTDVWYFKSEHKKVGIVLVHPDAISDGVVYFHFWSFQKPFNVFKHSMSKYQFKRIFTKLKDKDILNQIEMLEETIEKYQIEVKEFEESEIILRT